MDKHCVIASAGVDNVNANDDNIIFTIKDTKLHVPVVTLSAQDNKNYQNFLAKEFKYQLIAMNTKDSENKSKAIEYIYFL